MANITFTIPDAKLSRLVSAICGLHQVPRNPTTNAPLFTDNQWAKEYYRRLMVREVLSWERQQKSEEAVQDDTIVS